MFVTALSPNWTFGFDSYGFGAGVGHWTLSRACFFSVALCKHWYLFSFF